MDGTEIYEAFHQYFSDRPKETSAEEILKGWCISQMKRIRDIQTENDLKFNLQVVLKSSGAAITIKI